MKKFAVLLLLITLVLPLFSATPQTTRAQGVEINFVHIFGDENDSRGAVVQELVNEFTAQTGITVNLQTTISDYSEVLNSTLLAADQGDAPHVVQLDESAVQFAVDSDKFVKIVDIATPEQLASLDEYLPSVLNFYKVEGELWSLPWNSSNPVMYYNQDLFTAAGLDPANPPSTFEEITAACDALMSADLGLSTCINWPLTSWFLENWIAMQGALFANNDNGRTSRATEVYFDSPEMLSAVNWWKELAEKGYYSYTGRTVDYNGEAAVFITRKSAMHITSTAGLSNFQRFATQLGYQLGVAPLPRPFADATEGTVNGGASLWITAGHSEEELNAARDFAFFMTNNENIARWSTATGYFPNRTASIEQIEASGFWDENPFYRIAVDQLLATNPSIATSGAVIGPSQRVREILETAIQSIIDQGESPEDALLAAKSQADYELEDYNFFYAD